MRYSAPALGSGNRELQQAAATGAFGLALQERQIESRTLEGAVVHLGGDLAQVVDVVGVVAGVRPCLDQRALGHAQHEASVLGPFFDARSEQRAGGGRSLDEDASDLGEIPPRGSVAVLRADLDASAANRALHDLGGVLLAQLLDELVVDVRVHQRAVLERRAGLSAGGLERLSAVGVSVVGGSHGHLLSGAVVLTGYCPALLV